MDFPIKNGDFPLQNVSSPEGNPIIIPLDPIKPPFSYGFPKPDHAMRPFKKRVPEHGRNGVRWRRSAEGPVAALHWASVSRGGKKKWTISPMKTWDFTNSLWVYIRFIYGIPIIYPIISHYDILTTIYSSLTTIKMVYPMK